MSLLPCLRIDGSGRSPPRPCPQQLSPFSRRQRKLGEQPKHATCRWGLPRALSTGRYPRKRMSTGGDYMVGILARFSGVVLILLGIVLLGGGARLAFLGGSSYYAIAGAVMAVSGALYW